MIITSIKLSIEVENGDETEKDEFLKTISHLYHYEFVKENSGYGNKRYLQYLLTPAVHNNCGRKRKLSPEEEEEVRKDHFDLGLTIAELVSFYGVSKATVCRILKR